MFIGLVLVGLVPIALICLMVYYVLAYKPSDDKSLEHHFPRYALLTTVCGIIFLTLVGGEFSINPDDLNYNMIPFHWINKPNALGYDDMIRQLIANAAMFMPLGFFYPFVFQHKYTVLAGFLLSLVIEIIQFPIGRSTDVDDLIMNTVGALIGYLIYLGYKRFKK